MKRFNEVWARNRIWLVAVALVTGFSLLLAFAPDARGGERSIVAAIGPAQNQVFNDDLDVKSGQTIEGDVVVYTGDVNVETEGRITGNLTVYKGDVNIHEGGQVDGNLTSWSGDVNIDGSVKGSVSAMNGDVEIGDAAVVGGDISVMSGRIKQKAGAEVGGSILHGPNLKLPAPPVLQGLPWLRGPVQIEQQRPMTFGERVLGFFGRAFLALLALAIAVGGAAALMALREPWVMDVHSTLTKQAALSFAVGLIVNVLLLAVIGFLYITVCLRPPGLILGLGMAGLNIAGYAASGYVIGHRMESRFGQQWSPVARTALGVLAPGALITLFWLFGGCFAFFGYVGLLLASSFGVGAVLVKVLKLGSGQGNVAAAPVAVQAAQAPLAPTQPAPAQDARTAAAPAPVTSETPVTPPAWGEVGSASATVGAGTSPQATDIAPSMVETPAAWGELGATPAASTAGGNAPAGTDFTAIPGIGPKLSQRLKDAGVATYADLAAMTPAGLGEILGWSPDRVVRAEIIERAQLLASSGQ